MKDYLNNVIDSKETRAKEIRESIDAATTVEEVQRMSKELESVQEEIRSAKAELAKATEQRAFNPLATFSTEKMEGNDSEKRAKEFMESGRMKIAGAEARSILTTGSIAKPTGVGGINDAQNVVSSIVDQVKVTDCTGMGQYNVAYQKSIQDAAVAADGTFVESDGAYRYAAIKPVLVKTVSYVSRELRKQTPLAYEEKVKAGAMAALRSKVGKMIVKGNGTSEIYGIINAVNTENTPEVIYDTYEVASGAIDEKTLRGIVLAYGGDENVGGNATLYLNKTDLIAFGDVRGTDKKPVYEIIPNGANPNTGIIKDGGLSVPYCINSEVAALSGAASKAKTMIYGAPVNYELGLFGDYEVAADESYKFAEGLITIRGEVMVGGNVTADKGFIVVTVA